MSIKVFCTAPIGRFLDVLKTPINIDLKVHEYAVGSELKEGLTWCDKHISNARIMIDDEVLGGCMNVSMIYQPSIGHDNIRLEKLDTKPKVSGLWEEVEFRQSRLTTAEHTLSLILAHLKNHHTLFRDVKNHGFWDNRRYNISDLSDMKVGIIGFGCVGQGLARLLKPFGTEIFVFDPYINSLQFGKSPIKFVDYNDVLSCCDIISFHTPLNESTFKMFGIREIDQCSRHPLVVNCARGGIVEEMAIISSLKTAKISGYVCDVLENENPSGVELNQLVQASKNDDRVLISPHVGGSSANYMKDIFQIALDRVSSV